MDEKVGPDLSHPNSMIRLASTVLRFRCPTIGNTGVKKLSYANSFKTVGSHTSTKAVMKSADSARKYLEKSLATTGKTVPHKTIIGAAQKYSPIVDQILLTVKVQPEYALLDNPFIFDWASGVEKEVRFFKSEAIMYELVMALATEGVATAGLACDESTEGDFSGACRDFKKAAGIMDYLGTQQLPQWISKGSNVDHDSLPAEVTVGTCEALKILFLGNAQQMAVSTALVKEGEPKYSLLAKLCLGISEQLEVFVSTLRSKAPDQKAKMDPNFFTLMAFQIQLQKSLSMYFLARATNDAREYGLAIAMMNTAVSMLKTRTTPTGKGLPEIGKGSPLKAIEKDLESTRAHMSLVLRTWEKDNTSIYFEKVPLTIPMERKLPNGVHMMKAEPYETEQADPLPLILPDEKSKSQEDIDRDLAQRLQDQLNTE